MRLLALIVIGALSGPSVELRMLAASLLRAIIGASRSSLYSDLLLEDRRLLSS